MRVGKPAEEVECVDPEEGKIRIGKDESQERYVGHNPMTPLNVSESFELLERLRVGRRGGLTPEGSVGAYTMQPLSQTAQNVPAGAGNSGSAGDGSGGGG